jgi:hypothetical protein
VGGICLTFGPGFGVLSLRAAPGFGFGGLSLAAFDGCLGGVGSDDGGRSLIGLSDAIAAAARCSAISGGISLYASGVIGPRI